MQGALLSLDAASDLGMSQLFSQRGVGRVECGFIFNISQHYLAVIPTLIGVSRIGKRKEAIFFTSFGPKSLCEKGQSTNSYIYDLSF